MEVHTRHTTYYMQCKCVWAIIICIRIWWIENMFLVIVEERQQPSSAIAQTPANIGWHGVVHALPSNLSPAMQCGNICFHGYSFRPKLVVFLAKTPTQRLMCVVQKPSVRYRRGVQLANSDGIVVTALHEIKPYVRHVEWSECGDNSSDSLETPANLSLE